MAWQLALTLAPDSDLPLFLQIARALTDDIRRGRLHPGDPLPGSRRLAETLAVHRNTVLAAYRELQAEGWITTRPAGGTYVSTELPDPAPRRFARRAAARSEMPARPGYDLGPAIEAHEWVGAERAPGVLVLAGGGPDTRLVPASLLARAYRRALRAQGRGVLGYGDPRGHERLRVALAAMLSALRGLAATPDTVMVTRGSQMALDMVARALVRPGDVIAVEALGYRPAWGALRQAGARLIPVPVDEGGLRVDHLAALAEREPLRAVYLTPHHQYPTTVVLAPGRRLALLELARVRRLAIVEDDYDNEFHYDGRPVLPLASADPAGTVIYIGTLSKLLAPGLRLGFVVAPGPLIERLAALRLLADRQGDHAVEAAVAELIEDGELGRHARRAHRAYRARRDALAEALRHELGDVLEFQVPAGGMALWVRVDEAVDVDAWAEAGRTARVVFGPGRRFAFDGRARPFARLGFAALEESELREAVRRMKAALRAVRSPSGVSERGEVFRRSAPKDDMGLT
ncbi:MAG TPA: PLP-dependent aminotransferase family protein [Polyangia bacterium]|jgi:GntR family transcriptional regulator/MocR family aminotransferase|nr:PLP-dependent aminotransferase family protein [Polyangia bacterium]